MPTTLKKATATVIKVATKKATKKVVKPGTYAALMQAKEIAQKTNEKYTWHK